MAHADSRRDALEQLRKSFVELNSVQCRIDDLRKHAVRATDKGNISKTR